MTADTAIRTIMIVMGLVASPATHGADEKGSFGFAVTVDVESMFNHTLKSAVIQRVEPGLPAAAAGILPGDSVLAVQGQQVQGSKGSDIAALMKRKPGESVSLKLKRVNGDVYVTTLVAVPK